MKALNRFLLLTMLVPFATACTEQMNFAQSGSPVADLAATSPTTSPQSPTLSTPLVPTPTHPVAVANPAPSCPVGQTQTVAKATKILFLVDTSGSNNSPTDSTGTYVCDPTTAVCLMPTDPNKVFRGGAITNFFNEYSSHTNIQWGFSTFSGTIAQSMILNPNSQPVFSSDPTQMQTAITAFMKSTDGGATPFHSALQLATQMIQGDPDLNSAAKPNYYVIMITDGFPTDYTSSTGTFELSNLEADIENLVALSPSQVTLSTVYYGASSVPGAISLLETMASNGIGDGQFANENGANPSFKISDIVTIPITCQ